jgi:hypothetical protein
MFRFIKNLSFFYVLSTSALFSFNASAECLYNSIPTTSSGDFLFNTDGSAITHTKTGLQWQRCSLGQSWNGQSCHGQPNKYIWTDAIEAANLNNYAGFQDWRLPNRSELMSIIEYSCFSPSINETIFPNNSGDYYWSSSINPNHAGKAWMFDFYDGDGIFDDITTGAHVFLVRNAY